MWRCSDSWRAADPSLLARCHLSALSPRRCLVRRCFERWRIERDESTAAAQLSKRMFGNAGASAANNVTTMGVGITSGISGLSRLGAARGMVDSREKEEARLAKMSPRTRELYETSINAQRVKTLQAAFRGLKRAMVAIAKRRQAATVCLTRMTHMAAASVTRPLWLGERMQLILRMWHRYTKLQIAVRAGRPPPQFAVPMAEWNRWERL